MDTIDEKVDKIWEEVYEEYPDLMMDWIQCFRSNSYGEGKEKSKKEMRMTLAQREYQTDPEKNFLWRLMSKEPQKYGYVDTYGEGKRRGDLAMLFIQVMMENSYWKDFIATTLALHTVVENNCLETTMDSTTPLHDAARFENVEEVKRLIDEGRQMATNRYGYTPLHFAAMAINPKPKIAEMLLTHLAGTNDRKQLLDKQTNDKHGRNTALHIAAANVKVTEGFIQQFKDANPLLRDSKNDTPFHVAAKSTNPQAIIYMLNTFSPTNSSWDIDRAEGQIEDINTLVKICARAGNAEAVELLIKHGTDISQGVLHEIVMESVKAPKKIDDLVRVYQTIVDNAVTWRNLEERRGFLMVKGSDEYAERFRETMIWLLATPNLDYGREDVMQYALTHGAYAMFWQIINTKSVLRMDGKEADTFVEKENANKVDNKSAGNAKCSQKNWTVFDVTNLATETVMYASTPAVSAETVSLKSSRPQDQHSVDEFRPAQPNNVQTYHFDKVPPPMSSYLTHLLAVFHQWESSNILSTQPFKEIARPYIGMAQRFYFILGLLQLIFMITFTVYWMPTTCSLALMFNVSATGCSSNNTEDALLPSFSQQRSWIAMLWLIWPLILFAGNIFISFQYGRHAYFSHKQFSNEIVFKPYKALLQNVTLRVFCVLVFVWLYVFYQSDSHESYAKVTALVVLFGSITNMQFFGFMSMNFGISELVVREIIRRDIPSFMLFFVFNVVGFSFAIHIIRNSACMSAQLDTDLHNTMFAVLSSTFGIGDFIDSAITDPLCQGGGMQTFFDFMYFGYLLATIIILLNLLIAMMNNRYEEAKRKAENLWKFETLSLMRALESHWYVKKLKKKFNISDLWRPADSSSKSIGCYFGCCYSNDNRGSLIYNKKLNRYYLRLLLQDDEPCLEKF